MRYIFAATLVFVITALSFGQEDVRKVHYGLSLAPQLNISQFGNSDFVENKSSIGWTASGDIYFDLSSKMQLKTGIGFQYLGLRHRDSSAQWPSDVENGEWVPGRSYVEYKSNYFLIGVPVEFKLLMNEKANHIFFIGGFQMQTVVDSDGEVIAMVSGQIEPAIQLNSFLFEYNQLMASISLGIGYERQAGKGKIAIAPLLEYSLNDFFKLESSARSNGNLVLLGLRLSWYL